MMALALAHQHKEKSSINSQELPKHMDEYGISEPEYFSIQI